MNNCLITGASSGIGKSTAVKYSKNGWCVFGTYRDKTKKDELLKIGITPVYMDLKDSDTVSEAQKYITDKYGISEIKLLINCSGILTADSVTNTALNDYKNLFEINFFGIVLVIKTFLPFLKKGSKIINITSTSGLKGRPFVSAYCASKFAMEGFSESLRYELLPLGIDVVRIQSGKVNTPIWSMLNHIDSNKYENTVYENAIKELIKKTKHLVDKSLSPEDVADLIYKVSIKTKPKPCYKIVPNWFNDIFLAYITPQWVIDRTLMKRLFKAH